MNMKYFEVYLRCQRGSTALRTIVPCRFLLALSLSRIYPSNIITNSLAIRRSSLERDDDSLSQGYVRLRDGETLNTLDIDSGIDIVIALRRQCALALANRRE